MVNLHQIGTDRPVIVYFPLGGSTQPCPPWWMGLYVRQEPLPSPYVGFPWLIHQDGTPSYSEREIREAVDEMVREDDYSPERAQERVMEILRGRR